MQPSDFLYDYWRYYLMLEEKFVKTTKFVELDESNYNAFQNEYASLLQTIGSELDLFFKIFCGFDQSNRITINCYADNIFGNYNNITSQEIVVNKIKFKPFENWNTQTPSKSLEWWKAYNNIKHNRNDNMQRASQKNVLYILGALFLLEMKYCKNITQSYMQPDIPLNQSKLFTLTVWNSNWYSSSGIMLKNT